ncbi:MAG: DUF92 domain-containing protein [Anaerolineae bacterium]|nr:DUF92 domain-containing protein [Anaerolineae bacterium]
MAQRFIMGLALSLLIGGLGYRRGALSASGVAGAVLVGTAVFAFGGWGWGVLLVLFFASSSALSRFRARAKERVAEKFAKGTRRDLGQALANGGLGALLAVASTLWPSPLWFAAFVGAMAAVNADTWATEVGVLATRPPRLISTGRRVPPGTSGGVSLLGTAAALAGAACIGAVAALCAWAVGMAAPGAYLPGGAVSGLAGALADSLLGATVQGIYWCPACGKETERRMHACGTPTQPLRGRAWLSNDWVNFAASLVGAGVGVMLLSISAG